MSSQNLDQYVSAVKTNGVRLTSTEPLVVAGAATFTGTVDLSGATTTSGAQTITSTSANALAVGANGTTNPVLKIDASTASVATGLQVKGAAAASGVAVAVLSSGTNENLTVNAKGSGTTTIGSSQTGAVILGNTTTATTVNGPDNPTLRVVANGIAAVHLISSTRTFAWASGYNDSTSLSLVDITGTNTQRMLVTAAGLVTVNPTLAATAGGAAASGIQYGNIGVGVYTGTGAPTFSAMNGSIYTDSNATSTTTRIYVNKSGAGTAGTTWTNLTTAA